MSSSFSAAFARLLRVTSSPRLGLGRMQTLLGHVGDPHIGRAFLHVAGSNGKGSTLAFLDALLRGAGYKTGTATSPHLTSVRERIVIGGVPISAALFVELERDIQRAALKMRDDPPTFFERIITMAFLAFRICDVDIGLVEVGLGGRLDATNVITPLATGVAQIALDHQQWLGDDLAGIAAEKAGIFKRGVKAIVQQQDSAVVDVLRRCALQRHAPFAVAAPSDATLGLLGSHQKHNAGLALAMARVFADVDEAHLADANWPGRMERVHSAPDVWLDGAHNPAGLATLAQQLPRSPRAVIVGFTSGHDAVACAAQVERFAHGPIVCVQARAPRSLPADVVADAFSRHVMALDVDDALERCMSFGETWVVGSLYLVGEVRARFIDMEVDPVLPNF